MAGIPTMGQQVLASTVLRGEEIDIPFVVISAVTAVALSAIFWG